MLEIKVIRYNNINSQFWTINNNETLTAIYCGGHKFGNSLDKNIQKDTYNMNYDAKIVIKWLE